MARTFIMTTIDAGKPAAKTLAVLIASVAAISGCLAPASDASTAFAPRAVALTTTPLVLATATATQSGGADVAVPVQEHQHPGEGERVTTEPVAIQLPTSTSVAAASVSSTAVSPQNASDTPAPIAQPAPVAAPVSEIARAEQMVIDLGNAQRASFGLGPLMRDETIIAIARERVSDMIARDYFGHFDPLTGASLGRDLIAAAGFERGGEIIYWSGAVELADFPARAVNWFMNDPPHAEAILSPAYTRTGAGIAWNGVGWVLVQNFALP